MTTFQLGSTQLETFGVINVINEYLDMPDARGDNQVVPYRHGSVFVKKFFSQRVFTFGISITEDSTTNLEGTLDDLRALLAPRAEQVLTMVLDSTETRTISVSTNKNIQVVRESPLTARVVIELVASKPFWRGDTAITDNTTTIDDSPKSITVANSGTVEERDPVIILTGPLENTVITNTENGDTLTYTGTISAGHVVTIQTDASGEYTATHSVSGNVIGNVTHSGDSALMVFEVGDNDVTVEDDTATTGTVQITFYPPFM